MGARARWIMAGWSGLALLWLTAHAAAQADVHEGFRLERLVPGATPEDGFVLTLPDTLGHLRWSSTLSLGYALQPFQVRGPPQQNLVAQRLAADLSFALGLGDNFEAYARVPLVLVSAGDNTQIDRASFDAPNGFAMGDIAVGGTADVFRFRSLRLGARAELLLPTGNQRQLMGDYAIAPRGHALASYAMGSVTLGLEGGAVYRPHRDYALVRIGSEYEWAMAARFAAREALNIFVELFGTRSARRPREASALDTLDLLLGARHRAPVGLLCLYSSGALGTGFSDAAGDPDLRVLFNIALTAEKAAETSRAKAHDAVSPALPAGIKKD